MAKKHINSPNIADPVMMSLITPEIVTEYKELNFVSPWRTK